MARVRYLKNSYKIKSRMSTNAMVSIEGQKFGWITFWPESQFGQWHFGQSILAFWPRTIWLKRLFSQENLVQTTVRPRSIGWIVLGQNIFLAKLSLPKCLSGRNVIQPKISSEDGLKVIFLNNVPAPLLTAVIIFSHYFVMSSFLWCLAVFLWNWAVTKQVRLILMIR